MVIDARPSLAGLGTGRLYERPSSSRKVRFWLIAAVVVLGVGIWSFKGWFGGHVTECGFDAKGPYAKVRVGSLVGGLGA